MKVELCLLLLVPLLQSKRITRTQNELRKEICGATFLKTSMPLSFGGRHLRPNEFPWVVSIAVKRTGIICSGALISNRHVLTGAHCLRDTYSVEVMDKEKCREIGYTNNYKPVAPKEDYTITIGSRCSDLEKCPSSRIYKMETFYVPDEFDECSLFGDIAIIELDMKVPESIARPICMPTASTRISKKLRSAGTGMISPAKDAPVDGYQVVDVEYLGTTEDNLLETTTADNVGVCSGDSGGPLFQTHNRRNTVVGVMSSGNTCDLNYPGAKNEEGELPHDYYTDVRKYTEWICGVTGVCNDDETDSASDKDDDTSRSTTDNGIIRCPPGFHHWICNAKVHILRTD